MAGGEGISPVNQWLWNWRILCVGRLFTKFLCLAEGGRGLKKEVKKSLRYIQWNPPFPSNCMQKVQMCIFLGERIYIVFFMSSKGLRLKKIKNYWCRPGEEKWLKIQLRKYNRRSRDKETRKQGWKWQWHCKTLKDVRYNKLMAATL